MATGTVARANLRSSARPPVWPQQLHMLSARAWNSLTLLAFIVAAAIVIFTLWPVISLAWLCKLFEPAPGTSQSE